MTNLNIKLLSILLVVISLYCLTTTAFAHQHYRCKPPYTTLYVYTQPESKECVLLEHNGKVVQAQNNETG